MNNLLNIKSFLKFLGKNKAYTVIDVFGLSVSLQALIPVASSPYCFAAHIMRSLPQA